MEFDYEEVTNDDCWFKSICKFRRTNDEVCSDIYCPINSKMNYLIEHSLLSNKDKFPVVLIPDIDGTDTDKFIQLRDIQKDIYNFVIKGQNLFIYSDITGNGKSSWAKKLLLSWFKSIIYQTDYNCKGLYLSVPKFFNELRNNIKEKSDYIEYVKDLIPKVELVVWDDIGIKALSNWEHDILFDLINTRVEKGLANIFTSNIQPNEIKERLGDRIYSRIIQLSNLIELNGKDKRGLNKI